MIKSDATCSDVPTNADKRWPYDQYYLGQKDQENRRCGHGQNHWSGPESLEWFTGRFLRDTMHGEGDYRWRFEGPENASITYEGQFYGNNMHGYGLMSYPDGRVFNGIFYKNMRWGPGVESHACVQEDVGLWRGTQLIRLTWRPETPSVTLDLNTGPNAKACADSHRKLLTTRAHVIGEVNSAIELLKQSGADPLLASEKWTKLYPKHCTDFASQGCHVDVFDYEYYKNKIHVLEEVDSVPPQIEDTSVASDEESSSPKLFYAWNNTERIKDMMKHCYKHEKQRSSSRLDLGSILSGPRKNFKQPGAHELNCRTIMMASYLGHIIKVAQLINESNVHPDVADIQGNTALMYAACGDQADIVNFLVEAGADVNSYNDSCCTPLGVSLMKFTCTKKDIAANSIIQAVVPPLVSPTLPTRLGSAPTMKLEEKPTEWHIIRDQTIQAVGTNLNKSPSKLANKMSPSRKFKPSLSDLVPVKGLESVNDFIDDELTEEKRFFDIIYAEFSIRVADIFSVQNVVSPIPYLFFINDMVKELTDSEEDHQKKPPEKGAKKIVSKVMKDTIKPSKETMLQGSEKDVTSMSSAERLKMDALSKNMITILQLLNNGADPRLVRCPHPALLMATVSGSSDLVRNLVEYGADVNEVFPHIYNYTALDVAVAQPLTYENLKLARTLLECGARTDYTLKCEGFYSSGSTLAEAPGPTLLHTVLAKNAETEHEEEIRRQLLELLLEHNCSPLTQFKGSSALDMAMKDMDLLDIFIQCRKTNLNARINNCNQTVLVKMFSMPYCKSIPLSERLQTLTNLLLYGADPLLECQDGNEKFGNIFVFVKKNITDMNATKSPANPVGGAVKDTKAAKKPDKPKKEDFKLSTKSIGKLGSDDVGDYKQTVDLVTECARILHTRWLQAKLLKELIQVVEKFEHRPWNMIIPELRNKKACGLWLSCSRSLEIWDILKAKKKKKFNDRRILRHVLCIVEFYCSRSKFSLKLPVNAKEKDMIETDVTYILREHKIAVNMGADQMPLARQYVMPELFVDAEDKFQICFECAFPLDENKVQCSSCKVVSFCSLTCIEDNIDRVGCHPCSDYLRMKYFPSPEGSVTDS